MTIAEISKKLRISGWKLRQLLRNGKLSGVKIGGRYRIKWEQIENWMANGGSR